MKQWRKRAIQHRQEEYELEKRYCEGLDESYGDAPKE